MPIRSLFTRNVAISELSKLYKYDLEATEIEQFKGYIRKAADCELYKLNPRQLASVLRWSEARTLDVLTFAAAEQYWRFEWDIFCPGCGHQLQETPSLGGVLQHQTCAKCGWQGEIVLDQEVFVRASVDSQVRTLNPAQQDKPEFQKDQDDRLGLVPAISLINRPLFREMLGDQTLPPNQSLGVQHLAVFFSDLKGSTALYQRLGDSAAYQLVREHFLVIFDAVERHGGAAVKTIGDGVMGTFFDNSAAVLGIADSIKGLHELNQRAGLANENRLHLKVGLHAGPCIVVTLNHRLDYFGSTVNIASRLSDMAQGDDLLLSQAVLQDPQALKIVREMGMLRDLTVTLRGLPTPMPLHRLDFKG